VNFKLKVAFKSSEGRAQSPIREKQLSLPKIISANVSMMQSCPYRKSNPHVLMVQSTKYRPHFDAPGALDVPPNGRILAQR
jgi:hypothetical protein